MKSRGLILLSLTLLALSPAANAQVTQSSPPNWALDRIDQRYTPNDNSYSYTSTGAGVHIYIVDSGIRLDHTEFAGRLTVDGDFVFPGGNGADCYHHGTAVAGVAAGSTYGVAKGAQIHVLRVIGCTPDSSNANAEIARVVEALKWIRWHHIKPAVVNLSLNYAESIFSELANAITDLISAGVVVVSSAGNNPGPLNENWVIDGCTGTFYTCACDWYYGCPNPRMDSLKNLPPLVDGPPLSSQVIIVGASNFSSRRVQNTHWGVDVYAPGFNLLTASHESATATRLFSETSAAAPVVTGVVARYLQTHPTATPAQVRSWIRGNATYGVLTHCPQWEAGLVYIAPTD